MFCEPTILNADTRPYSEAGPRFYARMAWCSHPVLLNNMGGLKLSVSNVISNA